MNCLCTDYLPNRVPNNNLQATITRVNICDSIHIHQKFHSIWRNPFIIIRPISAILGLQASHRNKLIQQLNRPINNLIGRRPKIIMKVTIPCCPNLSKDHNIQLELFGTQKIMHPPKKPNNVIFPVCINIVTKTTQDADILN